MSAASQGDCMSDKVIAVIGLAISIVIWIGLLIWYAGYEDPRTPVQQQMFEERQNW